MNWTDLKKSLIILISLSVLSLVISKDSYECGFSSEPINNYTLFDPKKLNDKSFAPLFFTTESQYFTDNENEIKKEENISEWQKYFKYKLSKEELSTLIYKTKSSQIANVLNSTESKLKNKPLKNIFEKVKTDKDFLSYLKFAVDSVPLVYLNSYWDHRKDKDIEKMKPFIVKGKELYNQTKSGFLKERYAYQLVRLAHYSGSYNQCTQLFDQYFLKAKNKSLMYWWALGHKAGALYRLGKKVESAYLFSRVYDNCRSKRLSSHQSFKISTAKEWKDCLALCKNKEEKAALYFMRAYKPYNLPLEEINSIYDINPNSKYLKIIITREMNKVEYYCLNENLDFVHYLNRGNKNGKDYLKAISNLKKLRQFVLKQLKFESLKDKDFWKLTEAYLNFLEMDLEKFNTSLEALNLSQYSKQLESFKLIRDLVLTDSLNDKKEQKLYSKLIAIIPKPNKNKWQPKDPLYEFFISCVENIYHKNKQYGKAFLCRHDLSDLLYHPRVEVAEDLILLAQKANPNDFEKQLLSNLGSESHENRLYELMEVKGTMLLSMGKLEEAITEYKKLPEDFRKQYRRFQIYTNPFNTQIGDFDNWKKEKPVYTKLSFAEELLKLENELKMARSDSVKALLNYKIGTAYFNIQYEGSAWNAIDYFKSGYKGVGKTETGYLKESYFSNRDFFDYERALVYLKKGMDLDPTGETGAKCCFLAAKCERALNDFKKPKKYFKILKNNYSKTEFQQKVQMSCSSYEG